MLVHVCGWQLPPGGTGHGSMQIGGCCGPLYWSRHWLSGTQSHLVIRKKPSTVWVTSVGPQTTPGIGHEFTHCPVAGSRPHGWVAGVGQVISTSPCWYLS